MMGLISHFCLLLPLIFVETKCYRSLVRVHQITEPLILGEAPHWDHNAQVLYFVDILGKTIHKYDPQTGIHARTSLEDTVGFIIRVDGTTDQFLVGVGRKFLIVQWDGEEGTAARIIKEISEIDQNNPLNRINDGKADPKGRVYGGTVGHEDPPGIFQQQKGSLYQLDGERVTKVEGQVGISNGLAWDLSQKAMYYTDSFERKIRRYDYDEETGAISNITYIFDFNTNNLPGLPDGTTIDSAGNLWVANFNGSHVLNIDPRTGVLLRRVRIPAKQVTSVTFGGPNSDVLFVTTASMNIDEPQLPPSGSVFIVTGLGVRGLNNDKFKI